MVLDMSSNAQAHAGSGCVKIELTWAKSASDVCVLFWNIGGSAIFSEYQLKILSQEFFNLAETRQSKPKVWKLAAFYEK